LVSYIERHFSSSAWATGSTPSAPPALLTSTESSGTVSASSATEWGSVTSSRIARPPISFASSSRRSSRRAAATTSNPALARARAVAAPIPLLAPVMTATSPLAFTHGPYPEVNVSEAPLSGH
jgi:hypothetical protein